ncbi:hypothetical protein XAC3810_730086 [Xanthomonas citri pv. citri]|nr:hypothetical protein XAC3810_730086 [Xanthomonas citri pv. citri]CEJ47609.1 hypothetical protein XAB3213_3960008 [Xanthomonas citri pv. bilvae]CEE80034.1 hypothetical protein XAC2852_790089 [Xanthomonas citri pv. citri]CEE85582.1 hypothetical protein XACLC80_870086 [Xanthomonas citri pv. citri]CEF46945.1 hypothetical protein XAC217_790086 [Xanthomonas citri pv. citri]
MRRWNDRHIRDVSIKALRSPPRRCDRCPQSAGTGGHRAPGAVLSLLAVVRHGLPATFADL